MKILAFIILLILPLSSTYKYPQVTIRWVDIIATDSGWHTKEELEEWEVTEQDTVTQSGFLYKETSKYVILIDSYITEDHLGAAIKIPKGNIISIQRNKY